jgi:hypothetical protein
MKAISISQCSTCFERSIPPRDPSGGGSREGGVMVRGAKMAMYDRRCEWHRGLEDACNGNTAHRAELSGMVVVMTVWIVIWTGCLDGLNVDWGHSDAG